MLVVSIVSQNQQIVDIPEISACANKKEAQHEEGAKEDNKELEAGVQILDVREIILGLNIVFFVFEVLMKCVRYTFFIRSQRWTQ